MKKLILVLLILLSLCSCTKNEVSPRLKGISFTAELTYFNEEYVFDTTVQKDGTLTAYMKEPKELEELKLTVNTDGITADYKGLIYSANEATMPFSRIMEDFYLPLRRLMDEGSMSADKDGKISGKVGESKYILTVSPTGLPQKLELPDEHITVKFYNVTIKEE